MTDARIPERYLMRREVLERTPVEFQSWIMATVWCVANRTEGVVLQGDLRHIPCFTEAAIPVLVSVGLWEAIDGGWLIVDFDETQTSKAQLDAADKARRADRDRKRAQRAARKAEASKTGVSGRTSEGTSGRTSKATTQARTRLGKGAFAVSTSETENEVANSGTSNTPKLSLVRVPATAPADSVKLATEMNADPGTGEIPESSREYVHTDADAPAEWDGWPDDEKVTS